MGGQIIANQQRLRDVSHMSFTKLLDLDEIVPFSSFHSDLLHALFKHRSRHRWYRLHHFDRLPDSAK